MEMFKKEDIKVDYILKVRKGTEEESKEGLLRVCYNDCDELVVSGAITWFPVDCFDNELRYGNTEVIQIYGRTDAMDSWGLKVGDRPLLWKRKEPKKMVAGEILEKLGFTPENFKTKAMTVEEVCQELGYEVEIIDE